MRWLDCWKLKMFLPSLLNHFSLKWLWDIVHHCCTPGKPFYKNEVYLWRWDWVSFNSCVVNSCSNWHVGPLGFSSSDNLESQSSNEIVLWKDMLFFSISIGEVVDWTEYFQFQTISLNGCEVWDCFVSEGKEHSVFFYGKSNIVFLCVFLLFLLDNCFSFCSSLFILDWLFLSVFLLCLFLFCFSTETKSIWQVVLFLHFTRIFWRSQKHLLTFEIRTDGKPIMMEFRFCVREREKATKRERSYSQRKKGEGNIRAYVQKLRLLLEMKRKYRMQVPWRRRRRRRSSNPTFFPGAGFTRCCCK